MTQDTKHKGIPNSLGLIVAGALGVTALGLVALTTPFIKPALRRHCLPYVPATDSQLANLRTAFNRHSHKGDRFVDIGSGDGRICRLASELDLYSQIHGVELNSWLVLYSRLKSRKLESVRFFQDDLWKFPIHNYESVCIFGVPSMMSPLENYLYAAKTRRQIIYACRFPFSSLEQIDEIGSGIDTVWVYKLD